MLKHYWLVIATSLLFCGCGGYKVEGDKVYYVEYNEARGRVKRNIRADAQTLEVFDISNFAKDKDHVYYQGRRIHGADPATFQPLSDLIGKDKNYGYYCDSLLVGSHGPSFKNIDDYFTRDKNNVYCMYESIESCNPESFVTLDIDKGLWAKDECAYYCRGEKVPLSDYATFRILSDYGCGMAKDKDHVYDGTTIIPDLDAASFEIIAPCIGRDKFGCHNRRERCECPEID
jgi:hypothetical protein